MIVDLVPRLGPTVADYPPGSTFGPREPRFHSFVWLLRGNATWLCGDLRLPLRPGTLLLVRPGIRDSFHWDPHTPTRHAYVCFTLSDVDQSDWPLTRALSSRRDPMGALCQYLLHLGTTRPPDWAEHARETLRLLVLTFARPPEPTSPPTTLPEPIVAMMTHVRDSWSNGPAAPVPLDRLATAARVSASTLCRTFSRHVGLGPVAALELLRLARAEPLLWQSNLPMHAIAAQCGFADGYHFSRRFRAVYGMAPTAFRATAPETAPPSPVARGGLAALQSLLPAPG